MSDELFELKEMVRKLVAKNAELTEKNDKLEKENESLKAGNSKQKNSSESTVAIQTSQPMEGSNDFAPIIEKPKPKRFFKNWLLFDTLPWINCKELANSSMSTANESFRQLCWPKLHGNVKPHKIKYLRISAAHLELGKFRAQVNLRTADANCGRDEIIIPIASIPPLDYILGIGVIEISFVNDEILNFFKNIQNLLQNCQLLNIMMRKKHIASVRTLMDFLANKIFLLHFGWQQNELHLNDFNKFFPGFIDNIQFIQLRTVPNIDEIDTILNWLAKQSVNGKQKIIEVGGSEFIETFMSRINEEFSNSNSPSIFMINFETYKNVEEFTQENVRTNENLTLYRKNMDTEWGGYHNYCIARYPKGEEHWKQDGENKIREYFKAENTSILINIDA